MFRNSLIFFGGVIVSFLVLVGYLTWMDSRLTEMMTPKNSQYELLAQFVLSEMPEGVKAGDAWWVGRLNMNSEVENVVSWIINNNEGYSEKDRKMLENMVWGKIKKSRVISP